MGQSMTSSLQVGQDIVEQVWERLKPEELPKLRQAPKDRILVVKGAYDSIEQILTQAQIPYTELPQFPNTGDLVQGGQYAHCKVMFVNCDSNYHRGESGLATKGLNSENKKDITDFVNSGGRLITTDWAAAVVDYLFGNISVKQNAMSEEIVEVKFKTQEARQMSGIIYGNVHPKWWIERSSDTISYQENANVQDLIVSPEMQTKYGSDHICVAFKQGTGEVFHFVSHLIAQKTSNYSSKDRQYLSTFEEETQTKVKSGDEISFGGIETIYTLMHTVLELCRDEKILGPDARSGV
jgi:hypothetical protein